jgi:hypothetical protein
MLNQLNQLNKPGERVQGKERLSYQHERAGVRCLQQEPGLTRRISEDSDWAATQHYAAQPLSQPYLARKSAVSACLFM